MSDSLVNKVDHIGIAVPSIDEARKMYELLGLEVTAIEDVPAEGVRVAMIPCGETKIELLEPTTDDSPIAKHLEKRGPGIHHVCLGASDVRRADAALRDAGYRVLRDEPTRGAGGCWVQFVHPKSTGGVLLELSEPGESEDGHGGHG